MKAIYYSILCVVIFMFIGVNISNFDGNIFLEYATGYITLIACAACLYYSIKKFNEYNKFWGILNISASTTMFLMYFLWLAFNLSSVNNALSSFGFNISETLCRIQILYLMGIIKK